MKFSKFSIIALNTLAVIFLAPTIPFGMPSDAFGQPSDRLQSNKNRPELNLTEAQKQQMQSLKQNSRTQINAVLTDAQKTQFWLQAPCRHAISKSIRRSKI
jgi:Spy/CpxP family protein refolding chaperone